MLQDKFNSIGKRIPKDLESYFFELKTESLKLVQNLEESLNFTAKQLKSLRAEHKKSIESPIIVKKNIETQTASAGKNNVPELIHKDSGPVTLITLSDELS